MSHPRPVARLVLLIIKHPQSICLWTARNISTGSQKAQDWRIPMLPNLHNGYSTSASGALASQLNFIAGLQNHFCFLVLSMTTMAIPECPVVVIWHPLHQVKHRAWQAAHRPIPVVSHPHVQVSGVKVFKVLIERNEILQRRRKKEWMTTNEVLTGCHRAAMGCQPKTRNKKKQNVVTLKAERATKKKHCTPTAVK